MVIFYKFKRVYIRNVFCILFVKIYILLKLYVILIFFFKYGLVRVVIKY